ncbi:RtcB family protein [uncultured Paludibaculum sp.]|uniref:RtcB family protein n=1 Tax=uncultured Paludibaculum sp. TaxID=1765020 RepID=UPI002AAAD07F|nr:RtcB family protein [uncultured Paludibaculum sp.]
MSESSLASIRTWLQAPMDRDVSEAIERLRRAPDVWRVAVMPDVHLSADVCIGVVVATSSLIYPQAVGGDIGCGMLAVAFDVEAAALAPPGVARQILADLRHAVPSRRRNRREAIPQPEDLSSGRLTHPSLESARRTEGAIEFATLGSGNHFIELQADADDRLWLMVHSGSRALGPAIRDHHLARAQPMATRLRALEAGSALGAEYLHDVAYARRFAAASRRAMAEEVAQVLAVRAGAHACWETAIATDHNHVSLERHGGRDLWVHRKGAMSARQGESGVLPGSMGSLSFHVEGRGCDEALCSSAHGAGRALSRAAARGKITERELRRQMEGVLYDDSLTGRLLDEAPAAYKDIRMVLRAQRDLVKIIRTLRPLLNYKGV